MNTLHDISIDNNNKDNAQESSSILLVDDNFDIVRLMERALKEHGFKVSAFTDPAVALEDFQIHYKTCSLILSDTKMPKMNGYELIKKAKEIDKQVKVVLMSAFEINNEEFHNRRWGLIVCLFDNTREKQYFSYQAAILPLYELI
jgi:CheY-like chemotaxis protein